MAEACGTQAALAVKAAAKKAQAVVIAGRLVKGLAGSLLQSVYP